MNVNVRMLDLDAEYSEYNWSLSTIYVLMYCREIEGLRGRIDWAGD